MILQRPVRWTWLLAPLLMLALGASSALAQVKDGAKLFSQEAIQQAQKIDDQIQHDHHRQVMLETFAAVPDSEADNQKGKSVDAFFTEWAEAQAAANNINGVYILICMNPRHLEVAVGNVTQRKAFVLADRTELIKRLAAHLKAGENDAALTEAFDFVRQRMDANVQRSGTPQGASTGERDSGYAPPGSTDANSPPTGNTSTPWPTAPAGPRAGGGISFGFGTLVCLGVGALVLFLLVKGIFSGRGGANSGSYSPGYNQPMGGAPYGGGGGGGFGRGLLGGLLGGVLGGWGYDRFTRGSQGGGMFGGTSSGGNFGPSDDSGGTDTSYSAGGTDFGSGDSGAGGADFGGGGDSGGGGGDSGSSGSDF